MVEQMMQHKADEVTAKQTIPAGYKLTEIGVIPQDWNVSMLRDISSKITDGTHDTPKPVIEGIPFLTAIHVKDGKIDFDGCYFLPESTHNEIYRRCNPEFGDILMVNIGSGTATTAVVNVDYEFSLKNVALIKPNKENNGFYINYALSFSKNKIIDTILTGGAQPFLSLTQIALLQVPVPSREEQTTIANVLSDTDALIVGLEQLIAKKQAIKTAAMQQLLTGRTRLPQFALRPDGAPKGYKSSELGQIPEDWEVAPIGSVLSITTGARNTQDKVDDGRYPFFVRSQTIERINKYSFDGEAVLTAGDGVGTGKIFHYINGKFDFHQRVYLMYNFGERVSGYFFYLFFSNNFFDRIMSMTAKSSVDSVRREMITDMKMVLPSKAEQTAIATILSDMDSELTALAQKLAKARDVKQGMMQQLLTGRIRLPLPKEA